MPCSSCPYIAGLHLSFMIHTHYRITCDKCNRREYDGDEDETDTLIYAHVNGWRRRQVQNGAMWDFCPECVARDETFNTRTAN